MEGFTMDEGTLSAVDDDQLEQLKLLTKNLQQSVALIEANRGKENEEQS